MVTRWGVDFDDCRDADAKVDFANDMPAMLGYVDEKSYHRSLSLQEFNTITRLLVASRDQGHGMRREARAIRLAAARASGCVAPSICLPAVKSSKFSFRFPRKPTIPTSSTLPISPQDRRATYTATSSN